MNGTNQIIGRGRQFALPGIHELTKDQEEARSLPMNGQHLVIGGPGTGKSVVALLRAQRCAREGIPYVFLIYNRLLEQASRVLYRGVEAFTWDRWFRRTIAEYSGKQCPLLTANPPNSYKQIDWQGIKELELITLSDKQPPPHVVIDEGQDMPPDFYQALIDLGFVNIYVVADQNQQIVTGKCSSRREIERRLAIDPDRVKELKTNHRNSHQIARLARHFYTGDPASPPPVLPDVRKSVKVPEMFSYAPDSFPQILSRILKYWDHRPGHLLGIITPDNGVRSRYVEGLMNCGVTLDHPKPDIQTYLSGERKELHFDQGGIMVINAQSCKGLEFDAVFIADIECFHYRTNDPDVAKRLFYVMVARARRGVIMLRQAGSHCPIDPILPNDPEILERHDR
jgi:DNA helicase IV